MHVIHEPKNVSFEKVGHSGKVFSTDHLLKYCNFVLIDSDQGHETTVIQHNSDFIYYILSGIGYFIINGKKENCEKGNLVIITKGESFTFVGKLKMLLLSNPTWTEDQEETVF